MDSKDTDNEQMYAVRLKDLLRHEYLRANSNALHQIFAQTDKIHLERNGIHLPALNGTIYLIANFEKGNKNT